jgi:regulation of enolase protein 1 (concanavalin A-like superfamily)
MFDRDREWIWYHEPHHEWRDDVLAINTRGETDFWQGTHYGFRRDNGHCLLTHVNSDFSLIARVQIRPKSKYDQGGVIVRLDAENWIKISTETESKTVSRLGSVVTNLGYSDWATVDIDAEKKTMWYRVQSKGADVLIEYSETGKRWEQMRIAHLHQFHGMLAVGVYACSPSEGEGCEVLFDHVTVEPSLWTD